MEHKSWISAILLGLSVYFGLMLVQRHLGWIGLVAIVVAAGTGAVIVWMLDHDRPRLARAYGTRVGRPLIGTVARLSGRQVPSAPRDRVAALALRSREDFEAAARSIRRLVRGHDPAIDAILSHLSEQVAVRTSPGAAREPHRPLGIILLVGPEGVGKRHLAETIGRHLYRSPSRIALDLADDAADPIDAMLTALRPSPCTVAILENADRAPARTLERLTRVLADGRGRAASGVEVQLGDALIVMTCTSGLSAVPAPGAKESIPAPDRLASETSLGRPLLAQVDVIRGSPALDPRTRAEVIALLIRNECRRFGLELGYVAPEHLAREVAALDDAHGMALSPPRIARLLQAPLARAARAGLTHLDLN